jgi:hypothetical protein
MHTNHAKYLLPDTVKGINPNLRIRNYGPDALQHVSGLNFRSCNTKLKKVWKNEIKPSIHSRIMG